MRTAHARRKITYRVRLFITCLVIFLMPLCLIGIIGGAWARNTVTRNTEESYRVTMKNVAERLDSDLSSFLNVVTLFSRDPLIERITYMQGNTIDYQRVSPTDLHLFKSTLNFSSASSNLYSDVAICFPTKNAVISTLGLWQLDWFLEDEFSIASLTPEEWIEVFDSDSADHLIFDADLSSFGYKRSGIAYVRIAERNAKGQALMAVVFWIDGSRLDTYLADLALFPGTITYLADENGSLIRLYAQNQSETDAHALWRAPKEGNLFTSPSGTQYRIMRVTSPAKGWQYTVLLPVEEIYAEVHRLSASIILIFSIMLLLGCALSLELARINYRPLARIMHILGSHLSQGAEPGISDMEEMEQILKEMMSRQDEITRQVASNREMLQYAALLHLLEGDPAYRRIASADMLAMLELSMPFRLFCVCVTLASYGDGIQVALAPYSGMKQYLIRRKGISVLVINHQLSSLEGWAREQPNGGEGLCFSGVHDSIYSLPTALQEAMTARSRRPLDATGPVFFSNMPQEEAFSFSAQNERLLLGAVTEGDAARAQSLFTNFIQVQEGGLSRYTASRLAIAVELALLKTDGDTGALSQSLQNVPAPENDRVESTLAYARGLLHAASQYHAAQTIRQKSAFQSELLSYIHSHLRDGQLSLASTAAAFGITPTYLSRYFKEHMSMGYLEYVNTRRIREAKVLLQAGCSVREAAKQAGFTSDATFRRVYKKYEGYAPSRLQARNESLPQHKS